MAMTMIMMAMSMAMTMIMMIVYRKWRRMLKCVEESMSDMGFITIYHNNKDTRDDVDVAAAPDDDILMTFLVGNSGQLKSRPIGKAHLS